MLLTPDIDLFLSPVDVTITWEDGRQGLRMATGREKVRKVWLPARSIVASFVVVEESRGGVYDK